MDVLIAVRENTRGPRKTETALPNGQIKEETKYALPYLRGHGSFSTGLHFTGKGKSDIPQEYS